MAFQLLSSQAATEITVLESGELIISQPGNKIFISPECVAAFMHKLDTAVTEAENERDERAAEKARMNDAAANLLKITEFHAATAAHHNGVLPMGTTLLAGGN